MHNHLLCHDFKNSWQRQGQKNLPPQSAESYLYSRPRTLDFPKCWLPLCLDRCRRSLFGGIIFDGSFIPPSSSCLFLSNYSPFFPFTLMRPDMAKKKLNYYGIICQYLRALRLVGHKESAVLPSAAQLFRGQAGRQASHGWQANGETGSRRDT